MEKIKSFRAIGVARPVKYPDEVVIEYHEIDRETKERTGFCVVSEPYTLEQMWMAYRPVHIADRKQIEKYLAEGERANLGEVEVRDMHILNADEH